MTKWLVIIQIYLYLPIALSHAQEMRPKQPRDNTGLEKYLDGVDRRIVIHPKKPAKGINSGLVIAFGHPIPSPYLLEYRREKVFVNDVQVEPSPLIEQKNEKRVVDDEMKSLGSRMEKFISDARKSYANGATIDDILSSAKQQEGVLAAKLKSNTAIILTLRHHNGPVNLLIDFSDIRREDEQRESQFEKSNTPKFKNPTKRIKQHHLAWLKRSLQNGKCVIFLSEGGIYMNPLPKHLIQSVNLIMNDSTLNSTEKAVSLKNNVFLGYEIPARDIVANYSLTEWTLK
jgi:hypothetical protein